MANTTTICLCGTLFVICLLTFYKDSVSIKFNLNNSCLYLFILLHSSYFIWFTLSRLKKEVENLSCTANQLQAQKRAVEEENLALQKEIKKIAKETQRDVSLSLCLLVCSFSFIPNTLYYFPRVNCFSSILRQLFASKRVPIIERHQSSTPIPHRATEAFSRSPISPVSSTFERSLRPEDLFCPTSPTVQTETCEKRNDQSFTVDLNDSQFLESTSMFQEDDKTIDQALALDDLDQANDYCAVITQSEAVARKTENIKAMQERLFGPGRVMPGGLVKPVNRTPLEPIEEPSTIAALRTAGTKGRRMPTK
jgi:hypothetical protein